MSRPKNLDGCSICGQPVVARGWCHAHYRRWRRHGDPLAGSTTRGALPAWVDALLAAPPTNECCAWPFGHNGVGYGFLLVDGRKKYVTHVVLERTGQPRPSAAHEVLHACDNPPCANPLHLRWGLRLDNVRDMHSKDRQARLVGDDNPRAKLTAADVSAIRLLSAAGMSTAYLAHLFPQVGRHQIGVVVRGKQWRHLESVG